MLSSRTGSNCSRYHSSSSYTFHWKFGWYVHKAITCNNLTSIDTAYSLLKWLSHDSTFTFKGLIQYTHSLHAYGYRDREDWSETGLRPHTGPPALYFCIYDVYAHVSGVLLLLGDCVRVLPFFCLLELLIISKLPLLRNVVTFIV